MTFWDFADKHADALIILVAIVIGTLTSAFRDRRR